MKKLIKNDNINIIQYIKSNYNKIMKILKINTKSINKIFGFIIFLKKKKEKIELIYNMVLINNNYK